MANQKHLKLIKQGSKVWNERRKSNTLVDLSGADLARANLRGAFLTGAFLTDANLRGADLRGADLSMANLFEANFFEANLSNSSIFEASLSRANLSNANLSNAILIRTNLSGADLSGADLSGADLRGANLDRANLSRANLSEAIVDWTGFGAIDLRTTEGLESVKHQGPSTIGIDTLMRSQGNIPAVFLRGAGVSDEMIDYAKSLVGRAIEYYTCFLSYASEDQAFAERLYNDLQGKGVRCWFAPKKVKPGDFYRDLIDESIRMYDKVLLVLSQHSVKSKWVEEEVKQAWEKERASRPGTPLALFPIRLDDTVMQTKRQWAGTLRHLRHIGDFTSWKDHNAYQVSLQRLLDDLQSAKTSTET